MLGLINCFAIAQEESGPFAWYCCAMRDHQEAQSLGADSTQGHRCTAVDYLITWWIKPSFAWLSK